MPLLVTRPLATPLGLRPLGTLRPLEALLELLAVAGFEPRGALHAYRLYMGFLHGHVLTELQERVHDPDETEACSGSACIGVPLREFPRIRHWPPNWRPTTALGSSTKGSRRPRRPPHRGTADRVPAMKVDVLAGCTADTLRGSAGRAVG